jgi:hypothetical protein
MLVVREITSASDFDGLPLGLAAHTEPMSGCGTRPIGVKISYASFCATFCASAR